MTSSPGSPGSARLKKLCVPPPETISASAVFEPVFALELGLNRAFQPVVRRQRCLVNPMIARRRCLMCCGVSHSLSPSPADDVFGPGALISARAGRERRDGFDCGNAGCESNAFNRVNN